MENKSKSSVTQIIMISESWDLLFFLFRVECVSSTSAHSVIALMQLLIDMSVRVCVCVCVYVSMLHCQKQTDRKLLSVQEL